MMPRPTNCEAHNDARMAALSAPSIFSTGPKIGPMNMLCTISAVFAIPVEAIALAANGPPPAASHVVISRYNVWRPTWLAPPVMIRSMNSGVPNGKRSIFATGSSSPRAAESVRDQPRHPRMSAQRSADQVSTGRMQPLLKQAVGQQIGRHHHTSRPSVSCLLDGLVDMRVPHGGKGQM